jgi:hypothetical protein
MLWLNLSCHTGDFFNTHEMYRQRGSAFALEASRANS